MKMKNIVLVLASLGISGLVSAAPGDPDMNFIFVGGATSWTVTGTSEMKIEEDPNNADIALSDTWQDGESVYFEMTVECTSPVDPVFTGNVDICIGFGDDRTAQGFGIQSGTVSMGHDSNGGNPGNFGIEHWSGFDPEPRPAVPAANDITRAGGKVHFTLLCERVRVDLHRMTWVWYDEKDGTELFRKYREWSGSTDVPFDDDHGLYSIVFREGLVGAGEWEVTNFEMAILSQPPIWTYAGWIEDTNLTGADTEWDADPDGDGVNNLSEYGLGGDPEDAAITGLPVVSVEEDDAGNKWMVNAYRRYASDNQLTFNVLTTKHLIYDPWVAVDNEEVVEVLGPAEAGEDYEIVTNRVEFVEGSQYFRVEVGTTEDVTQPAP